MPSFTLLSRWLILSVSSVAMVAMANSAHAQDSGVATEDDDEDVIIVKGIRQSLSDSIISKREANQIVDVITSEEIGLMPDQNVTEALQRITGVQITRNNGEGETVNIRGLAANFTRVEVDGRSAAITLDDANPSRASVLSVFSSELYNTIEVIKSPTAKDIEGGIGGIVRLKTPDPLGIGELAWGGEVGLTEADAREDTEFNANGFYNNVFADDRVGLLIAGTFEQRDRSLSKFQSNQNWNAVDNSNPALGFFPGRLRQEYKSGEAPKFNFNAKLQYQATPNLLLGLNGFGSQENRDEVRDRIQVQFSRGRLLSSTVDASTNTITDATFDRQRTDIISFFREADISTRGLTGDFDWEGDLWSASGELSVSSSEEDLAEYRASTRINRDGLGGYSISNDPRYPELFTAGTSITPSNLSTRQLDLERRLISAEEKAARIDFERMFDSRFITSFETGFRYSTVDFDRQQGFQVSPGQGTLTFGDASRSDSAGNFAEGFGGAGILREWPTVDAFELYNVSPSSTAFSFNNGNFFNVNEDIFAAYGMINFENAESDNLYMNGNLGLRVVGTKYTGDGRVEVTDTTGAVTNFDDAPELNQSYTNVLPAFNLILAPSEDSDWQVRGAITRALSRADIDEINPAIAINADDQEISRGNPDLNPFLAWQYDLGLEYYFGGGEGLFSIAYFNKDISNFIVEINPVETGLTFPQFGLNTPLDYNVSTFANGGDAKVQGFEVGFQTPFYFLPGLFSDFGIFANYTYTDSEFTNEVTGVTQQFPGSSENAYNFAGYYDNGKFSTRLAYTYRDNNLLVPSTANNGSNAQFNDSQGRLDLGMRYRFENGIRVSFDALNLTEEQNYKYYDTPQRLEDLVVEGRIYSVGIGYVFN